MKKLVEYTVALLAALIAAGCSGWKTPSLSSEEHPQIFPDYIGVTVPSNIAPLNFMVEDADHVQASFAIDGQNVLDIKGKDGIISIPVRKWRELVSSAIGKEISIEVSVWNDVNPAGVQFAPFAVRIAEHEIDPWIAYRLIEPGYVGWRQIGLYQRNMTDFEESAIVTNHATNTTCLNCHHFPDYSSDAMMFHARGENGGTILYKDGKLKKINFKEIGPKKNTTYPAWHPEGRYIAFSSNTTHQVFFGEGQQPIEVYDTASDLVIYDTESGEVLTDPRFLDEKVMETFPGWSPDGKYLYYAAADARNLPNEIAYVRYHLLRVGFDTDTGKLSERIDTLYNAYERQGSVSYPRISPDGKYLLYTRADNGTFPIWHPEADLCMMDLSTGTDVDVSVWNDAEHADSYHSWSSNGRWMMFGSRRLDGRYTRLYIAYFDEDGRPHKPFLLPQEDPRYNIWRLKSFNVPEFIDGEVELPNEAADMFYSED